MGETILHMDTVTEAFLDTTYKDIRSLYLENGVKHHDVHLSIANWDADKRQCRQFEDNLQVYLAAHPPTLPETVDAWKTRVTDRVLSSHTAKAAALGTVGVAAYAAWDGDLSQLWDLAEEFATEIGYTVASLSVGVGYSLYRFKAEYDERVSQITVEPVPDGMQLTYQPPDNE